MKEKRNKQTYKTVPCLEWKSLSEERNKHIVRISMSTQLSNIYLIYS